MLRAMRCMAACDHIVAVCVGWGRRPEPGRPITSLGIRSADPCSEEATMCRIVAYCGDPIRLSQILLDPPHSLKHQSQAAEEMSGGTTAGDGWGVGWFLDGDHRPA